MYAIALAFRKAAWRVFLFTADERPDRDAVLYFAGDGRSVLLVFDGVADIADDVAELLRMARERDLKIACLAVDHTERSAGIVGRLPRAFLADRTTRTINPRLNSTDARRLVDHLSARARLGTLERLRQDRQRVAFFRNREIFSALSEISDAPAFGRRVGLLVSDMSKTRHRELVFFASMADKADRSLLTIDAGRMVGAASDDIVREIQSLPLRHLLWTDGVRVYTRHRWLALDPIIEGLGRRNALDVLATGLTRLSGRLGRAAHRERNATVLLVGALMAHRSLSRVFPDVNLESWYSRLQKDFGDWSGRYWEQRAIAGRHAAEHDEAALARSESYALRATTLVPDTYSFTTLGTILAARTAAADFESIARYYDRTFDAFEEASRLDPTNLVTWRAFLRHTLPIVERLQRVDASADADLVERVHDDWARVHGQLKSIADASEDVRLGLNALKRRFDMLFPDDHGGLA